VIAWCEIGGVKLVEPRPGQRGGGAIYGMILQLVTLGYDGAAFEAHDGRIVCLRGIVSPLAVPTKYGGECRNEKE
jgi:hypothetical protein